MKRNILKSFALILLISAVVWNIAGFTQTALNLPPREVSDVVGWEREWTPFQDELVRRGYTSGDLGFITAGTLKGMPSSNDQVRRAELSYVVIPLNLVLGRSDTPFVIGEFSDGKPSELPANLIPLVDSGRNFVLFRNTETR